MGDRTMAIWCIAIVVAGVLFLFTNFLSGMVDARRRLGVGKDRDGSMRRLLIWIARAALVYVCVCLTLLACAAESWDLPDESQHWRGRTVVLWPIALVEKLVERW